VVEGNMIDISAGGLAFTCRQPVKNDQQISIAFKLPETAILIHVTGKVIHVVEKNGWRRAGMEFTSVPPREFASLEQWLVTESQKLKERFISPDSARLN
jgi:c-di-GMP-binding flagellar brake protein YcgR